MMVNTLFGIIIVLFDVIIICIASTHWVVTENGRIQSQIDSVFRLKKPYDLIEFLNQGERVQNVVKLYEDIVKKKLLLDNKWATLNSASEMENILSSDDDCISGREELLDFETDTNFVEYASDDLNLLYNNIQEEISSINTYNDLDCSKFYTLDFSMTVFPHLQVLIEAWNLTWSPESDISIPLSHHQIYHSLNKNKTSWYHYNLASLYWRQKGDAQKAIDCIKRSIHFAPRYYKDIPMFNLGIMLQKAQYSEEAAILLQAAIDHAPHKPKGHFVLANIYTTLGEYNRSIASYDNALTLKPNWAFAKKAKHAIICHNKIKHTLTNLQTSIEDIINQLQELNTIQDQLLKNQEDILFHQQTPLSTTFSTLLSHTGECLPKSSTDDQLLCDFPSTNVHSLEHMQMDPMSLELLLSKVESQAQKISDFVPLPTFQINNFKNSPKTEVRNKFETLIDDNKNDGNSHNEKIHFKDSENFAKYQIK